MTDSTSERSREPAEDLDFWNADVNREQPREASPPLAIPVKPVRRFRITAMSLAIMAIVALGVWLRFLTFEPPPRTVRSLPVAPPVGTRVDTPTAEPLEAKGVPQPSEQELREAKLARLSEEQAKQIRDLERRLMETERFTQRVRESALKSDELAIRRQLALAQSHLELGCQEVSERRVFHLLSAVSLSQVEVPPGCPELVLEATRIRESCRQVVLSRISHAGRLLTAPLWHDREVTSVAISPDGTQILTGSLDNTARLWDAGTGQPIGTALRHPKGVTLVAFSPDGERVLTACYDHAARLWDARTGEAIGEPMKHSLWLTAMAFSPQGDRLITACYDGTARLWDSAGQPMGEPMRHDRTVTSAAMSSDGQRVVTGSRDRTARLWDGHTGALLGKPMLHADWVTCVAFSPDGELVLTGSGDRTARVWEATTCEPAGPPIERDGEITRVAFNPDGLRFVVAGEDGSARLYELETGRPLGEPLRHSGAIGSIAFSPAGDRVITGSADGTARVWDAGTGTPIGPPLQHEAQVTCVAFDADGSRVLTASADRGARIWAAEAPRPLGYRPLPPPGSLEGIVARALVKPTTVRHIEFRPDGKSILECGGGDSLTFDRTRVLRVSGSSALLIDTRNGETIRQFAHGEPLTCAAVSPDGTRILTATAERFVRLWDAETGAMLGEPLRHHDRVSLMAFSPDGSCYATYSHGVVQVWSTETREPLGDPARHDHPVQGMAISPDGQRLLTWSWRTAYLWKLLSGKPIGSPMQHADDITCAIFSPEGTEILTGSRDSTARLWDGATGESLGVTVRHSQRVNGVAFTFDGSGILTGSEDRTARLWDAISGFPLGEPMPHADAVLCVAIGPRGDQVATGGRFGTQLWNAGLPPRELPTDKLAMLLTLWSGRDAHQDRHASLSADKLDALRVQTAEADPIRVLANQSLPDQQLFHEAAAAEARNKSDWYAAKFHGERVTAPRDARVLSNTRAEAEARLRRQFEVKDGVFGPTFELGENADVQVGPERSDDIPHVFTPGDPKEGRISLKISRKAKLFSHRDDLHCFQRIAVRPHTRYRLSGWIKTENVQPEEGRQFGAALSIHGTAEMSDPLIGTHDWTHVELVFDAGHRRTVRIGPRLGHENSRCSGTAWFDELEFEELSDASPPSDASK